MRIFKYIFLTSFLIPLIVFSQTGVLSDSDDQEISQKLQQLVESVRSGDIESIISLIDPENNFLRQEIEYQLSGRSVFYQLSYFPLSRNSEVLDNNKIQVNAKFSASGTNWNISGLSSYFVFEKKNNEWFISDTDFHIKIGPEYILKIFKKVMIFAGPIFIMLFVFWVWMLVDAVKRNFDDKTVWIIILIFTNILGAVLYFFIVKRKNITSKPLEFKQ